MSDNAEQKTARDHLIEAVFALVAVSGPYATKEGQDAMLRGLLKSIDAFGDERYRDGQNNPTPTTVARLSQHGRVEAAAASLEIDLADAHPDPVGPLGDPGPSGETPEAALYSSIDAICQTASDYSDPLGLPGEDKLVARARILSAIREYGDARVKAALEKAGEDEFGQCALCGKDFCGRVDR